MIRIFVVQVDAQEGETDLAGAINDMILFSGDLTGISDLNVLEITDKDYVQSNSPLFTKEECQEMFLNVINKVFE